MGWELAWESLVLVRARSSWEEEMLGALFLQEENPVPALDIAEDVRRTGDGVRTVQRRRVQETRDQRTTGLAKCSADRKRRTGRAQAPSLGWESFARGI